MSRSSAHQETVRQQADALLGSLKGGALGYASLDGLLRLGQAVEKVPGQARLGSTVQELATMLAQGGLDPSHEVATPVRQALQILAGRKKGSLASVELALRKKIREGKPRVLPWERRILVVDDDRATCRLICRALERAGFQTRVAHDGESALAALREERPALVLLDVMLPDVKGNQVLRRLRRDKRLEAVPVIFVSAKKRLDVKLDALRHGADDYITKPFRSEELVTRVAARLERGMLLQEIAIRDPLTKVATHRFFHEHLEEEMARAGRYKTPFAVALADIDGLAAINEERGFEVGDQVVVRVSQALRAGLRRGDLVARMAGGEFGVILPHANLERASEILDRLRARLASGPRGSIPAINISCGVAGWPDTTSDRRGLLSAAREALEKAKREGKGKVVLAHMSGAEPPAASSRGVFEDESAGHSLREVFLADLNHHLKTLDALEAGSPARTAGPVIGKVAHFLAGAGAVGGYPELSELGGAVERLTDEILKAGMPPPGSDSVLAEVLDSFLRIGARLRSSTYQAADSAALRNRIRQGERLLVPSEVVASGGQRPPLADVLVVDDEKVSQAAIGASLRRAGFSIREAYSGAEALELVGQRVPDIIILDVILPDMDGHAVLAKIRSTPKLQLVPVIFVTAKQMIDDKVQALRTGADDYITKPFQPEELVARISSRLERAQISKDLAMRDGLTGLYNHRFFQERLEHELSRSRRYRTNFCLALLDIDDFKRINDRHGHQAGDAVLRQLAAGLTGMLRSTDVIARYGGEEFAIIMPETPIQAAAATLERTRESIASQVLVVAGTEPEGIKVSFSGGLAAASGESKEELFQKADAALYVSKRAGKNRITLAGAYGENPAA